MPLRGKIATCNFGTEGKNNPNDYFASRAKIALPLTLTRTITLTLTQTEEKCYNNRSAINTLNGNYTLFIDDKQVDLIKTDEKFDNSKQS